MGLRRFLEGAPAEFRRNGGVVPADKRQRLETLEAELAQVTQKYGENVLASTNAWDLIITDENRIAGLPESVRTAAQADAKAKGNHADHKKACG